MLKAILTSAIILVGTFAAGAQTIDNSALDSPDFRKHARTFGLVYTLPEAVNEKLASTIGGMLREDLLNAGLSTEAQMFNIPHVTVVHIHNADPTTPEKMLKALPALPGRLDVTLKTFYTTEAAKDAGRPWWLDLGIVKEGQDYEKMMAFSVTATAALAPLRDGPLPRVTGPVYAKMGEAAKNLVKTMGVSGVNIIQDGKATTSHNPHNTLVYSMAPFTPAIQAAMNETAKNFNQVLPDGIKTTFRTVSIVELAFAGNVLREIYRINLDDGSVLELATGKAMKLANK
ncbi:MULTISPECIES: hypothetical protein [unclassified Beijerinckia]|uniref:hypothetical protein n=1 Tax=unclassified Beijerinckia TaxID=2638183 RepID=UPI0008962148|nr:MULTISPECIES: hypothetical protein [unclassified Beijerinckia]MDH7794051.1 hypothetical protein [Beijerinckia sp. GAS462]SEB52210.1 hypothetical protein SAMN05443249_0317 [Beijerinckia sp. 28-YEA-48]